MSESRGRPLASSSRTQRRQIRTGATENSDLVAFLKSNGKVVPPGLQIAKPLRDRSTSTEAGVLRRPEKQARRESSEPPTGVSDLRIENGSTTTTDTVL